MSKPTARAKGDALERAVRAIESVILQSFPGFSESTFRIEGKKIINASGVRHEIDIHVTASFGKGYDAIFIFECKNWLDKINKNEIMIFSGKVKASDARRGFFVAKSYTRDAMAQAELDPRIELLRAEQLDASAVAVPANFHAIQPGKPDAVVTIKAANTRPGVLPSPIDLKKASFMLKGEAVDFDDYIHTWIVRLRDDRFGHFPSATVEEGCHILDFEDARIFDAEALVNGQQVRSIRVKGTFPVEVAKPVVVSAFDVATRGRFITVQVNTSLARLTAEFVQIEAQQPDSSEATAQRGAASARPKPGRA